MSIGGKNAAMRETNLLCREVVRDVASGRWVCGGGGAPSGSINSRSRVLQVGWQIGTLEMRIRKGLFFHPSEYYTHVPEPDAKFSGEKSGQYSGVNQG